MLLDSHLQAHLLEVNSRPSIYTDVCNNGLLHLSRNVQVLDMAVNGPLVQEMFQVVGYHLPQEALAPHLVQVGPLSTNLGRLGAPWQSTHS